MKDIAFDTQLIAASPYYRRGTFVKQVMKQVRRAAPLKGWRRFAHFHRLGFAVAIIVALATFGGAVYAAVQLAPALLPAFFQVTHKEVNQRGAVEYAVTGLEACTEKHQPIPLKFEIKKEVTLTDEEVRQIIQAKCEMGWAKDYANKTWPAERVKTETGETIVFTYPERKGTVKSVDFDAIEIAYDGKTVVEKPVAGQNFVIMADGKEVLFTDLKPGDTVLVANRIRETYPDFSKPLGVSDRFRLNDPRAELGTVAIFKLSLPRDFYFEKQRYLTEIPACHGNTHELCPATPSIDIYPRTGGESARNPYARPYSEQNTIRDISGTVTTLTDGSLTLTTRAGNIYTVTLGSAGFKTYNRDFVRFYTDLDATLKIGSNVTVRYSQSPESDPKDIRREDVMQVMLMLEALNVKQGNVTGY